MCDASSKFSTRWKDHRPHGETTTSKGINPKFLDCDFPRLPREDLQMLDAIQQHVSATDSRGTSVYVRAAPPPHHHLHGHEFAVTDKRRTERPERRNRQVLYRTFLARMWDLRRCEFRTHLESRQMANRRSEKKMAQQSTADCGREFRIWTPGNPGNNNIRARHHKTKRR